MRELAVEIGGKIPYRTWLELFFSSPKIVLLYITRCTSTNSNFMRDLIHRTENSIDFPYFYLIRLSDHLTIPFNSYSLQSLRLKSKRLLENYSLHSSHSNIQGGHILKKANHKTSCNRCAADSLRPFLQICSLSILSPLFKLEFLHNA